ncbi:MAG: mechanosensitive ion channel [Epsilonproteobacteria bacterium]|nr:mechanosensitive ion channel [Campylobacterota bacterium]
MRILLAFIFFVFLYAKNDINQTIVKTQIQQLKSTLENNEFYLNYLSYLNYKNLEKELKKYKYLLRKNPIYKDKYLSIKTELELLKNYNNIFTTLIKIKNLPKPPEVTNPFAIFTALNYEKELKSILKQNSKHYKEFLKTYQIIKKIYSIEKQAGIKDKKIKKMLNDFKTIKSVYKTKLDTQKTQAEIYIQEVNSKIQRELNKLIYLAISIGVSILIFTVIKLGVRKYVKDESIYIVNKIINFLNITVIVLIISFFYINNATYLITILGFASAGIAIAMKDWFMNLFGWVVIMISGNFKVGDRIKIYLQNGQVRIVGDVIDITLNRIVIYEDVTLTTYRFNKRAGRIVFVPNNVVFTNPIFNYTHHGLSTVWDNVDVTITFDSNYKKAVYLAKEIANKYSKGYTDITKRRLKKLKSIYHIKNENVEPRIYTFIEDNGIRISCWYLNNYVTLKLRSSISAEIIEAFNKEDDIQIAYPTYQIQGKVDINHERFNET